MGVASPQNRWRMSKLSMEYSKCCLISFGIVFFLDFASDFILPIFAFRSSIIDVNKESQILFISCSSSLQIVVCIPLSLCLLRPFISQYVPGMLKRMGLGMFFVLLSLIATYFMDLAVDLKDVHNDTCMLAEDIDNKYDDGLVEAFLPHLNPALLLFQLTLSALSHILIYTAVFEFICSQSPHSMKGLLIGLLYAIRGLYLLLAILLVILVANLYSSPHQLWILLLPHKYSYWSGCSAGVHVCC